MINYPSMYSFLLQLHFVSNPFHCLTSGLKSKGFPVDFVDQFKCKIRGYKSFKFTFSLFWETQVLFWFSSFSSTFETCSENRKLLRKLQSIRDMFLNNWVSGNKMNKKWWITGIIEGFDDKRKSFKQFFSPRLTVFQNVWGSLFQRKVHLSSGLQCQAMKVEFQEHISSWLLFKHKYFSEMVSSNHDCFSSCWSSLKWTWQE